MWWLRLNCLQYGKVLSKSQINRGETIKNRTDFLIKMCCNMCFLTGVVTEVGEKTYYNIIPFNRGRTGVESVVKKTTKKSE